MLKNELKNLQNANMLAKKSAEQNAYEQLPALLDKYMKKWAEHIIKKISDDAKFKLNHRGLYKKEVKEKLNGKTVIKGTLFFEDTRYNSKLLYTVDLHDFFFARDLEHTFGINHYVHGIDCMHKDFGFRIVSTSLTFVYVDVGPILFTKFHRGGYYGKKLLSYLLPMAKENGISLTVEGRKINDDGTDCYSMVVSYSVVI